MEINSDITAKLSLKPIRRIVDLPWTPRGRILDPFAGLARWWRGCDVKPVLTDLTPSIPGVIQSDAAHLPFPDNSFDEIWADPPHIIKQGFGKPNPMYVRFGMYKSREDCHKQWINWSSEFARLAPIMVLKTIDKGNPIWCVTRTDLDCFREIWQLDDEIYTKTSPGWSKALTLYTRWHRIS